MAMAAVFDAPITRARSKCLQYVNSGCSTSSSILDIAKLSVAVGDRVVYLGNNTPEHGTIRWIGMLPEISESLTVGLELDNPVGTIDGNWAGRQLFTCPSKHGMVIDINALIKEKDFMYELDSTETEDADEVQILSSSFVEVMREESSTPGTSEHDVAIAIEAQNSYLNADDEIQKFMSSKSTPKLYGGSFDRRVYACMFTDCEVDKFYEALEFDQDGVPTVQLDSNFKTENEKRNFNKNSKEKMEKGLCVKKERGGIFKFIRWLRRNKTTKTQEVSVNGTSETRKTLSSVGFSRPYCDRAASLESVTSLSRSFHYIPAGVESHGSIPLTAVERKERFYQDIDATTPSPMTRRSEDKRKANSMSKAMTVDADCYPETVTSLSRKKRQAPLPPTLSKASTSASSCPDVQRSHWVRVLPAKFPPNHELAAHGGKKDKRNCKLKDRPRSRITSSTGDIARWPIGKPPISNDARCSFMPSPRLLEKQTRSSSLTGNETQILSSPVALKSPNISRSSKKKRKAPPPPLDDNVIQETENSCKVSGPSEQTVSLSELKQAISKSTSEDGTFNKVTSDEADLSSSLKNNLVEKRNDISKEKPAIVVNNEMTFNTDRDFHQEQQSESNDYVQNDRTPTSPNETNVNMQTLQEMVESLVQQYCSINKIEERVLPRSPNVLSHESTSFLSPNSETTSRQLMVDWDRKQALPIISNISPRSQNGGLLEEKLRKLTVQDNQERSMVFMSGNHNEDDSKQEIASEILERWQTRMNKKMLNINWLMPDEIVDEELEDHRTSAGQIIKMNSEIRDSQIDESNDDHSEYGKLLKKSDGQRRPSCINSAAYNLINNTSISPDLSVNTKTKQIRRLSVNGQSVGTAEGDNLQVDCPSPVDCHNPFHPHGLQLETKNRRASNSSPLYENMSTEIFKPICKRESSQINVYDVPRPQAALSQYWSPTSLISYPGVISTNLSTQYQGFIPNLPTTDYPNFLDNRIYQANYVQPHYGYNCPKPLLSAPNTVSSSKSSQTRRQSVVRQKSISEALSKNVFLQEDANRRQKILPLKATSMPSTPTNMTVERKSSTNEGSSEVNHIHSLPIKRLMKRLEVAISSGKLEEAASLARNLAQLKIQCTMTQNHQPSGSRVQSETTLILNMFVEDKVSHHGPIPIRVNPSITVGELKNKIFREFEFPMDLQRWILGNKLAVHEDWKISAYGIVDDGCPVFLYLLTPERAILKPNQLHWDNEVQEHCLNLDSPIPKRMKNDLGSFRNEADAEMLDAGWECLVCTLRNVPTRPGCDACGACRPDDYQIPDGYKLPIAEQKRLEGDRLAEEQLERALLEAEKKEKDENQVNYMHLMELEYHDLVTNEDAFDCNVCYGTVNVGDGVKLRDCLHLFCRECLTNVVTYSEEANVKCPYRDDDYACDSILQEREIRALVSQEEFDKHLQKGVNIAENQAKNSFHCKTADCKGWCYFEDDVNTFECPVCEHANCLTCRVIHEGQNCRQYQDQLNARANFDEEAQKTKKVFDDMLNSGQAMHCPGCNIVIMKKWGCDAIVCSICKMEICWVTKGPRWGPAGKGDTSGGCKCNFALGKRCHPLCTNCH